MKLREGRYFKYKGDLAESIINDYKSGMKIRVLTAKYQISNGGLYGLIKRWGTKNGA